MATQNAANQQFANNADGFALGGGTTVRTLTVTSGSPTISGGGSTLTLGGNLTTGGTFSTTGTFSTGGNFSTAAAVTVSGAYALTVSLTGTTSVTLPTSGTLEAVAKAVRSDTTGTFGLTTANVICLANCSGGNITYNLPAVATSNGHRFYIKKTDSSSNIITVDANASETIDGATTQTISVQYQCLMIACDGSGWFII